MFERQGEEEKQSANFTWSAAYIELAIHLNPTCCMDQPAKPVLHVLMIKPTS